MIRFRLRGGADGVLLLSRSDDPEFVADLRIFNPDGSEAELSGKLVIEAQGLSKAFGGRTGVEDLSLRILRGDRLGLVGPNRARVVLSCGHPSALLYSLLHLAGYGLPIEVVYVDDGSADGNAFDSRSFVPSPPSGAGPSN